MRRWFWHLAIALAVLAPASPSVWPQASKGDDQKEITSGEVRRIKLDEGTITLKHDAIDSMQMPPMTMTFKVNNPALLAKVKVGDKVKFRAERLRDGTLLVIAIERAP